MTGVTHDGVGSDAEGGVKIKQDDGSYIVEDLINFYKHHELHEDQLPSPNDL